MYHYNNNRKESVCLFISRVVRIYTRKRNFTMKIFFVCVYLILYTNIVFIKENMRNRRLGIDGFFLFVCMRQSKFSALEPYVRITTPHKIARRNSLHIYLECSSSVKLTLLHRKLNQQLCCVSWR